MNSTHSISSNSSLYDDISENGLLRSAISSKRCCKPCRAPWRCSSLSVVSASNSSSSRISVLPPGSTHTSSKRSTCLINSSEIDAGSAILQYQPFLLPSAVAISNILNQRSL